MPHHALEITLTRPATQAELARAVRIMPLAANCDRTRLMTVAKAKNPDRALSRAHHRLKSLLPLDVLTTHYPDTEGSVLLAINFSSTADAFIRRAAEQAAQSPRVFLQQTIHHALAHHARQEAARLDHALRALLAHTSPDQLLAAVGRTLTHSGTRQC
ncbi:hypothetical protein OG883_45175 [Streptomyces sp. NBC_01142]|uniref:hypothetical protein n=1 Tax=Streptomyces sp. NBC_01142 TaxID=2975865 RepID=UPI002259684A|nr:hypothetical protein [Streptomyces sp. NBC_01142]MCX4826832.1 hypothetical protein [Streptomyces sp. NBC_01142]